MDSVADWSAIASKWNTDVWGGYYLGLNPDQGKVRFNVGSADTDGSPMPLAEWTHIAAVYDMNQIKI
ncbi:MAG: hypothetical protein HRT57_02225 [Crocinitomicaceae bacterium]|nr:hypothetical protein [Crocinitomicaceae bacterium]